MVFVATDSYCLQTHHSLTLFTNCIGNRSFEGLSFWKPHITRLVHLDVLLE